MERVQQYRYNDKMRDDLTTKVNGIPLPLPLIMSLTTKVKGILRQRRVGHRQPDAFGNSSVPDLIAFNKTQGLTYGRKEVGLRQSLTLTLTLTLIGNAWRSASNASRGWLPSARCWPRQSRRRATRAYLFGFGFGLGGVLPRTDTEPYTEPFATALTPPPGILGMNRLDGRSRRGS